MHHPITGNKFKKVKRVMRVPKMRYFAYCEICEEYREVQSKRVSGNVRCVKHRVLDHKSITEKRLKTLKLNSKENNPKKKSRHISKEAIEKARELNRKHREAVKESKPVLVTRTKTEEELIAEFLAKNKVTVIPTAEDTQGLPVNIKGEY